MSVCVSFKDTVNVSFRARVKVRVRRNTTMFGVRFSVRGTGMLTFSARISLRVRVRVRHRPEVPLLEKEDHTP